MSTPTCRTCDTKFPGKHKCKTCGADPNAEPTLDWKIEQAKAKPKKLVEVKTLTARDVAKVFGVRSVLIADSEMLRKERATRKARIRSLVNTQASSRRYKHGRVGVR